MRTDAGILERIFTLTRGDLDSAVFPLPHPPALFAETETVRILRLSRFWQKGISASNALLQHTLALLAAFHAQNSHFALVIRGIDRDVECWIGAQKGQFTKSSLASMVRGALPDARIDEKTSLLEQRTSYPFGTILTGTPSLRSDGDGSANTPSDQIESALRGLAGRDWMFIVTARPRRAPLVAQGINEIAREIHDVRATMLLGDSPLGRSDRTAERYVELLEAKLRRFELGRTQGLWDAYVAFIADAPVTLNIGRGLLQSAFSGDDSLPDPLRACTCAATAGAGPPLEPVPTRDLAILARLPHEEYPGYEIIESIRYGVDVTAIARTSTDIVIGDVFDRGSETGKELRIPADDLTKHALVVGVTGSGKTTSCISVLRQAWSLGVPFLVIESAKSEYRSLLRLDELAGIRVFTAGDETIAPLRLNPFEVPPGILVQTHVDYVKSLFSAAFVLYPPMPYVLEQSIQEIYEDRGWDLARNVNRRGASPRAFPRLGDLSRKISDVVDRMGYDTRITMDVKAGLLARVNQLRLGGGKGLMLDCRTSVGTDTLFGGPCIVELKSLVLDDEKAFLIGLVLIRLYEHCETTRGRGRLQHLTVIEEAHRLLRNTSFESGADTANPRGRAVEVFTNILSEVRAYGEGIIIAEQIPAKLTPDAIKNTGTKIVHRLVAQDDRELVGAAMNLGLEQVRGLALLEAGESVAFAERLQKPVLLRMRGAGAHLAAVTDRELAGSMRSRDIGGEATAQQPRIDTRNIALSFRRFVNALRFEPGASGEYYDAVVRNVRLRNAGADLSVDAALAALAEAECESRGAFYEWSFADVDRAVEALADDIEGLAASHAARGRFTRVSEVLHARTELPFAGCVHCARPCQYRFDVQGESSPAAEFRKEFLNVDTPFRVLAGICLHAVSEPMPMETGEARRQAALCFGVARLHQLQISESRQVATARRLADALGRPKGEPLE